MPEYLRHLHKAGLKRYLQTGHKHLNWESVEVTGLGSETILLVEDERDVREVAREFLSLSGYTVLEARDAAEAIEIAARHSQPIHLLVTDMVMPGMGGRELAARLAPLRPEMKVVYMSGYTEYAHTRHGELGPNTALLTKPFTRGTLARTVRGMLHGGKRD